MPLDGFAQSRLNSERVNVLLGNGAYRQANDLRNEIGAGEVGAWQRGLRRKPLRPLAFTGGDLLAGSRTAVHIGLLFSTTGPYQAVGRAMLNGALLALEEVNADASFDITLVPVIEDPGGVLDAYSRSCERLLAQRGLSHVVGCYTSSSRKEVLPQFEKHDALLWYPSHYEGFESTENVIYTGAAPNQHIIPLVEYMLSAHGRRVFLIGSNYIWAWENNRIMREMVQAAGGAILGERYFPVTEADFASVVCQILDLCPDFVFNTLIGEAAYGFFREFRAQAAARHIEQPKTIPIASCSLSEPELIEIGPDAVDGHISSSVYFESVRTPENEAFVQALRAHFPYAGPSCADTEASFVAVHLLARAIRLAGTDEMAAVRAAAGRVSMAAPQGRVAIDPESRHCWLTPRIGRSTCAGRFEILYEAKTSVRPDPYLLWHIPRHSEARTARPAILKVVR